MKSIKSMLLLLIGMIAFVTVSCSNDSEQKQDSQVTARDVPSTMYTINSPKEGEDFILTYENENGSIITENVHWKEYQTGLEEVPVTQSLFKDNELKDDNTNGTAKIKSATRHITKHGYYYTGCLVDDNTGQTMVYYYAPAQIDQSTLIMQTHPYFAQWPTGPDNC